MTTQERQELQDNYRSLESLLDKKEYFGEYETINLNDTIAVKFTEVGKLYAESKKITLYQLKEGNPFYKDWYKMQLHEFIEYFGEMINSTYNQVPSKKILDKIYLLIANDDYSMGSTEEEHY